MKALIKASFKVLLPLGFDKIIPGLGSIVDLAVSYSDERGAENIRQLFSDLSSRVSSLSERLDGIESAQTAEAILGVIALAFKERTLEKMGFFAGILAGELLDVQFDWELELREQFNEMIAGLTGPEITILCAMYHRKQGEALPIPQRQGGNWLSPDIQWNNSTNSWIDSLVNKGLICDASIEKMQTGFGSPGSKSVKSRSSVGLSPYARTMIEYMLYVQQLKNI